MGWRGLSSGLCLGIVLLCGTALVWETLSSHRQTNDDKHAGGELTRSLNLAVDAFHSSGSSGQATSPPPLLEAPCPKVFKYKLPDAWLERRAAVNRGHMDGPYPNPWGEYLWPNVKGYHATKHKSAPAVVERLLDNYGSLCLTADPHEAQLFFIPWYRDWFCGGYGRCNFYTKETTEESELFDYISNQTLQEFGVDFFKRNYGYDHFQLSATMAAINLVPKYQKWFLGPWTNVTTISSVGGSAAYYPFVSFARFEPGMPLEKLPWAAARRQERQYLVFMAWGSVVGKRGKLLAQCNERPELCASMVTSRKDVYSAASDEIFTSIVAGYQQAVFCVQVGVETCSRKGFIDALTLGCIVVAFTPCPLEYYNDYIDMRHVAIQLDPQYAVGGLIEYLRKIPLDVILDMQLYIAQFGHQLQYSRIESQQQYESLPAAELFLVNNDAFFTMLRVANRTANRAVQCNAWLGHYQPRFGVCCERSNDCNPLNILSEGIGNACEGKMRPPCYFPEVQMHDTWSTDRHRAVDPINRRDFLRSPKPWILEELPPMTMNSTW